MRTPAATNSVEWRPVGSSEDASTPARAFQGRRIAARRGESSGKRPMVSPCTVSAITGAERGGSRSGLRRNAPTIEPADVPTMTSAFRASYPRSASARSTPRWKASPVTPPAPNTSPTLLMPAPFPGLPSSMRLLAVVPGSGDSRRVDELAHDPRGVAGDERVVGDVLAHHRTGGDEASRPDRHAGQDDRPGADPGAVADADRGVLHRSALDPVAVAVHPGSLVGDRGVVAARDLQNAHQDDAAVDEHPVAEADPTPSGHERLAVARPDLEVVADLEVGGVDGRVAEDRRLGAHPLHAAQPPLGVAALLAVGPPPARLEHALRDGGPNSGQGGHGQRG